MNPNIPNTPEHQRLNAAGLDRTWRTWGPYLSQRAWGTVREDYSPDGSAWEYFPHDHARSRAFRWNEDGLLGICDHRQTVCFAMALWNGHDPILKERAFGLTGNQGNHGEDVKEYFFFADSTPTHSYMKAIYKYPHAAYPYQQLIDENARRSRTDPEFELFDTGIFNDNRYFDVQVEYAKASPEDVLIRFTIFNRGPDQASLTFLPTVWFRNTWRWIENGQRPVMSLNPDGRTITWRTDPLGPYALQTDGPPGSFETIFTDNETNQQKLYNAPNPEPWVKDAFDRYIVHNDHAAVNPQQHGSKAAFVHRLNIPAGQSATLRLRLSRDTVAAPAFGDTFDQLIATRIAEADAFFAEVAPQDATPDLRNIQRQSLAGLLWSKQFYNYDVITWLQGDPTMPPPPMDRWDGRNHEWTSLYNDSVLSMPDSWEYPWYAAWDLAFHTISLALVDPDFAKRQLILLLREWFMHPSGQLPAYEWSFSDVNPPVHAWAVLRVFRIERRIKGKGDRDFLERAFQKLVINFTWWVNRKDSHGRNVFQGGFLGLDNIGFFDRSKPLPDGAYINQSDGTAWMAAFCLNMMAIAIELAYEEPSYEDMATKFLEHFFIISHAMNAAPTPLNGDVELWDETDGFYYDVMHHADGQREFLKVRSVVGLIPLLAVETVEARTLERFPDFARRLEWFITNRPDIVRHLASVSRGGKNGRRLFALVTPHRLRRIIERMLDESEFLSPYGLRSVSAYHRAHPATIDFQNTQYTVDYEPAESTTPLFGGNSNWRGPVWFPTNFLIIEALQKFDYYYGDDFMVDFPTGSGNKETLWGVATDLSRRLIALFARDADHRRAVFGGNLVFQNDPLWRDLIPFHEYFHGDNGAGLGASHQTGWTALVAKLIQQSGGKRPRASGAGGPSSRADQLNAQRPLGAG